eukprot:13568210-Alexandrium_andersonii.AAC.1
MTNCTGIGSANSSIPWGGAVSRTVRLARQAADMFVEQACLWLRGVVPRSIAPIPDPPPAVEVEVANCIGLTSRCECKHIYVDGSGTHSDVRLRRCGWSAVIIEQGTCQLWGA